MAQFISAVTLLVDDYDRAINFYVNSLGFTLVEDTKLSETKRWVLVAPSQTDAQSTSILIAKADTDAQIASIGQQTGGRVSFSFAQINLIRIIRQCLKKVSGF